MSARRVRHLTYTKKRRLPRLIVALGVFVFLALLLRPTPDPPRGERAEAPPESVIGWWTTEDSRYRDRFLRVTRDSVMFGVGQDEAAVKGRIGEVRRWTEEAFQVVDIAYNGPAGPDHLEIIVHGRDRMHLRNPPEVVWIRR